MIKSFLDFFKTNKVTAWDNDTKEKLFTIVSKLDDDEVLVCHGTTLYALFANSLVSENKKVVLKNGLDIQKKLIESKLPLVLGEFNNYQPPMKLSVIDLSKGNFSKKPYFLYQDKAIIDAKSAAKYVLDLDDLKKRAEQQKEFNSKKISLYSIIEIYENLNSGEQNKNTQIIYKYYEKYSKIPILCLGVSKKRDLSRVTGSQEVTSSVQGESHSSKMSVFAVFFLDDPFQENPKVNKSSFLSKSLVTDSYEENQFRELVEFYIDKKIKKTL